MTPADHSEARTAETRPRSVGWVAAIVITASIGIAGLSLMRPGPGNEVPGTDLIAGPSACEPAIGCVPDRGVTGQPLEDDVPTPNRWSIPDVGVDARPSVPERTADTVIVEPGDDLSLVTDAHSAGTRYILTAGVHELDRIVPKDGDEFIGEPGAIVSGADRSRVAFTGDADDVLIEGLVIEAYRNPAQTGAIHTGYGAERWTVRWNEFRNNAGAGLGIGPGWLVQNNFVHHNHQIGFISTGADGTLVEENELAFNNFEDEYDMAWEAGGAKFVKSEGLVLRGNYVHDNHGPGLWTDIDNIDTLYEGNIAENNFGPGILHEISYDAVIRNNLVAGNAHDFYIGGILVSASQNVHVYDNLLIGNHGGVSAVQEDRGAGRYGPWVISNLSVQDNDISYSDGWTGIADYVGDGEVLTNSNRFVGNTYRTPERLKAWMWGDEVTWQEWLELGFS